MIKPSSVLFWAIAAAWMGLSAAANAQLVDEVAPNWQPYRELSSEGGIADSVALPEASAGVAAEDFASSVQPAQWMSAEGTPCPPPVCCAPSVCCPPAYCAPCEAPLIEAPMGNASCYLNPAYGPPTNPAFWQWRVLPEGVIWQSYWAGAHESRISGTPFVDDNDNTGLLDVTLGGRVSLLRFGTEGQGRPQGAELQVEGAGIPRLNLDENWDMESNDFRFGVPLVYGRELWQAKFSYYHLSSHMGDEFAIRNNEQAALDNRINFSRDALVLGFSYFPLPAWRWYAEAGWAFHYDVSEPWEFQFGVDVAEPGPTGIYGTPFLAINGHLREEVDFGGNVVVQAGWLWRGDSTRTVRLGFHYYNGKSSQFEFFNQFEEQIGAGLWCDF